MLHLAPHTSDVLYETYMHKNSTNMRTDTIRHANQVYNVSYLCQTKQITFTTKISISSNA